MAFNSWMKFDRSDQQPFVHVHPFTVRVTHWINALAIVAMIASGWRIYNASPFVSVFPRASRWAAGSPGLCNGICSAVVAHHQWGDLLAVQLVERALPQGSRPDTFRSLGRTSNKANRKLAGLGVYNGATHPYVGVIIVVVLLVLSGLAMEAGAVAGAGGDHGCYEGARLVHFFAMCFLVSFVVIHVIMVLLVPRTLPPMITGRARRPPPPARREKPKPTLPSTEAGDAL
jgi:thiosulfate reductase cytochrome b subunit